MSTNTDLTIGFLGLGNMGGPLASSLAQSGHDLLAFDPRAAQLGVVVAAGARPAASATEVIAAVDVLFTMLPDTPDVEAVVHGAGGILEVARPGLLHVDMSTIAPSASLRFAEALERRGLAFVDAAVGRSALHAARGESLFMVGARDADLARLRPLFEVMGDTVIHCGPPGSGIAMKIVNNFQGNVQAQVTAEALTLGARLGLSADLMVKVMSSSLSVNGYLTSYYPIKALAGDIEPGFAMNLAYKDLSIAIDLADELGVPVAAGAAARACVDQARTALGEKDVTALLDAAAIGAGLEPPRITAA